MVPVARKVQQPESAARDLFDPKPQWEMPKEFSDYLDERRKAKTATLEVVPTPVPPAWAVEAAVGVAAPPPRDFAVEEERVRCDAGLVVRWRTPDGAHLYRAYERTDVFFHAVHLAGDVAWGRIDTRRPATTLGPEELRAHQRACEDRAVAAILAACIETESIGEPPSCGVFLSPGYVLVLVDPEPRYRAAREKGKR